jgi:RNA-binding protein 25
MARERVVKESEERDRVLMKQSLEVWDDDESDELFYLDRYVNAPTLTDWPLITVLNRAKWRARRATALAAENAQDQASKALELREAEHLRMESEAFLARQMDDMRSLQEEQRKAGLLLVGEDAGPLRLNMSLGNTGATENSGTPTNAAPAPSGSGPSAPPKPVAKVFGDVEDEEEEHVRRRRKGLVKLDFGAADGIEATKDRLNKLKDSISKDKDVLFKFKVRWEALSDVSFCMFYLRSCPDNCWIAID